MLKLAKNYVSANNNDYYHDCVPITTPLSASLQNSAYPGEQGLGVQLFSS